MATAQQLWSEAFNLSTCYRRGAYIGDLELFIWTRLNWQNLMKLKHTIMHFHVLFWPETFQNSFPAQPRLAQAGRGEQRVECVVAVQWPSTQPSPAQPALNLILLPLCLLTASSQTPWHWNWLGASSHNWRHSHHVIMCHQSCQDVSTAKQCNVKVNTNKTKCSPLIFPP